MARTLRAPVAAGQGNPVAPAPDTQDNAVAPTAYHLRAAIDAAGWKHTAIAAAIAVDPPYLARMLSGEKPIADRHLKALPPDVRRELRRIEAEAEGYIVAAPISDAQAFQFLALAVLQLLRPDRAPVVRTTSL